MNKNIDPNKLLDLAIKMESGEEPSAGIESMIHFQRTQKPPSITVSGADEKTSIADLKHLDAEIALLYTFDPEGRNRYPSLNWINEAVRQLPRTAIHICGGRARQQLLEGQLSETLNFAKRIQVNGNLSVEECEKICQLYPWHTIITQHKPKNIDLLNVKASNHSILIDSSGGEGRSPDSWPKLATNKAVGFAGGLGPDNLMAEMEKIKKVSSPGWWIDMEGKLRDNDWFSIEKANKVVSLFHESMILEIDDIGIL